MFNEVRLFVGEVVVTVFVRKLVILMEKELSAM
jgi:hypothetical protein